MPTLAALLTPAADFAGRDRQDEPLMHALHLETAGGATIVLRGANLAHLRLLATDLLRFKRYVAARLFDPEARQIESIVS